MKNYHLWFIHTLLILTFLYITINKTLLSAQSILSSDVCLNQCNYNCSNGIGVIAAATPGTQSETRLSGFRRCATVRSFSFLVGLDALPKNVLGGSIGYVDQFYAKALLRTSPAYGYGMYYLFPDPDVRTCNGEGARSDIGLASPDCLAMCANNCILRRKMFPGPVSSRNPDLELCLDKCNYNCSHWIEVEVIAATGTPPPPRSTHSETGLPPRTGVISFLAGLPEDILGGSIGYNDQFYAKALLRTSPGYAMYSLYPDPDSLPTFNGEGIETDIVLQEQANIELRAALASHQCLTRCANNCIIRRFTGRGN